MAQSFKLCPIFIFTGVTKHVLGVDFAPLVTGLVEMLKDYMVRVRLGIPNLEKLL